MGAKERIINFRNQQNVDKFGKVANNKISFVFPNIWNVQLKHFQLKQ